MNIATITNDIFNHLKLGQTISFKILNKSLRKLKM